MRKLSGLFIFASEWILLVAVFVMSGSVIEYAIRDFNAGDFTKAVAGLLFCGLFVFREIYVLVILRVCEFDGNQLYLTNFLLRKRIIPYDAVIYIQKKKCDGVPIVYLSYGFFFIKYKMNRRSRVKIINIQNVDYWKQFKEMARNKNIQVLEPASKTI